MGSTFWVPKQGDDDMMVIEVKKCLGSVTRESSQLVKESNLYMMSTIRIPLFHCSQIGL
jgi:hypothetical protein